MPVSPTNATTLIDSGGISRIGYWVHQHWLAVPCHVLKATVAHRGDVISFDGRSTRMKKEEEIDVKEDDEKAEVSLTEEEQPQEEGGGVVDYHMHPSDIVTLPVVPCVPGEEVNSLGGSGSSTSDDTLSGDEPSPLFRLVEVSGMSSGPLFGCGEWDHYHSIIGPKEQEKAGGAVKGFVASLESICKAAAPADKSSGPSSSSTSHLIFAIAQQVWQSLSLCTSETTTYLFDMYSSLFYCLLTRRITRLFFVPFFFTRYLNNLTRPINVFVPFHPPPRPSPSPFHLQSLLGQRTVNRDTGVVMEPAALSIKKGSQLYVRKGRAVFTFEATPAIQQIPLPSNSFSSDLNRSTFGSTHSRLESGSSGEGLSPGQNIGNTDKPTLFFHPRLLCIKAIEIVTSRWDSDKCSVTLRAKIVGNPAAPEAPGAVAAPAATSTGVAAGAEEELDADRKDDVGASDFGGGWTDLGPSSFPFHYSPSDHKVVGALSRPKKGKIATSMGTTKSDEGENDCGSVLCSAFQLIFTVEDYNVGLHQVWTLSRLWSIGRLIQIHIYSRAQITRFIVIFFPDLMTSPFDENSRIFTTHPFSSVATGSRYCRRS
jgi:hypothetical protein